MELMEKFEQTCSILRMHGYRPVSMDGPTKRIFIDDDTKITVSVELDKDKITSKDEELIKRRLKELGYL